VSYKHGPTVKSQPSDTLIVYAKNSFMFKPMKNFILGYFEWGKNYFLKSLVFGLLVKKEKKNG
jgi:hypothetical protein